MSCLSMCFLRAYVKRKEVHKRLPMPEVRARAAIDKDDVEADVSPDVQVDRTEDTAMTSDGESKETTAFRTLPPRSPRTSSVPFTAGRNLGPLPQVAYHSVPGKLACLMRGPDHPGGESFQNSQIRPLRFPEREYPPFVEVPTRVNY